MQKSLLAATTALALLLPGALHAQEDVLKRVQALEQELAILKRQLEVKEEVQQSKAEKNASVELNAKRGLVVTSPNKDIELRIRAYAQADHRAFADGSNNSTDQFLIRSARPILEAKVQDDYFLRFMFDFGGSQTRLLDAYADYRPSKALNFRVGKFKSPIGLERWQSEQEILFVERGLATNLVPFRDLGVQLFGELLPQQLEYQLAFTNGTTDLGDSNGDADDAKDITARVFAHPFRNSELVALQGLGVGVAGSIGEREGTSTASNLTDGYRSNGQARIFTYNSGAYADGTEWRINPQAYFYHGPFGALAEYVKIGTDVRRGAVEETLSHEGWTAVASYVLTGEDASFDGVKVREKFDPEKGQWGAWEVLGRVGQLKLDNAAFGTFADPAKSVREAREYVAGLTWYLNDNLKWNANYAFTTFEGGATAGADREDEQAILNRLQFRF